MIQDIEPHRLDNQYKKTEPNNNDRIFHFINRKAFIKKRDTLDFIQRKDLPDGLHYIYLFSIDDKHYFLLDEEMELQVEGYEYVNMFSIRDYVQTEEILAVVTGFHLYGWYKDNRYCGRCGKKTYRDEKERMIRCTCGNMIFPRIVPAVIVGIKNKNKLLLTKYKDREYTKYALIAGFTEIGESLEQTVKREVMEEVGLKVKNITYYKSQPWGFDMDLLAGFFCDVEKECDIVLDEEELSLGIWKDREDIPEYDEELSLTFDMMMAFKRGDIQ